jgi:hypothetical protein
LTWPYHCSLSCSIIYRNEFWDKKCLEIQSYLGSKKSSESWKFIKNVRSSNNGKSQLN